MPSRLLPSVLLGWVLLLSASAAHADQFEIFTIDPTRSHLAYQAGEIAAVLPGSQFLYATLDLQPGSASVPLSGEFVMQVGNDASSPTFFRILSGASELRAADANAVSPGMGGAAGTIQAALGVSFLDSALGVGGEAAIHDLVFGIVGFLTPRANGLGPNGLDGNLGWVAAGGAAEIATTLGIGGTALVASSGGAGFVDRNLSQFSEVAPGVYEVVMPFAFDVVLGPLSGPVQDLNLYLQFSGEIFATTAVPEPALGVLSALGGAALGFRRRWRGGR